MALELIFGYNSATDRARESVKTSCDSSFWVFLQRNG